LKLIHNAQESLKQAFERLIPCLVEREQEVTLAKFTQAKEAPKPRASCLHKVTKEEVENLALTAQSIYTLYMEIEKTQLFIK
jgi:uncharacterized protein YjgD (DUF1641 family)